MPIPFISIRYKIYLAFLSILVPIIIVSALNYFNSARRIERLALEDLELVAKSRRDELALFIETVKNRIEDFSSDGEIIRAMERPGGPRGEALSDYIEKHKLPFLKRMFRVTVTDSSGVAFASTIRSEVGKDFSKEGFFLKGLKGVTVVEAKEGGRPGLAISAPITGRKERRTVGVITGFASISSLKSIFENETKAADGILETSRVYLVNMEGVVLADEALVGATIGDTPATKACLRGGKNFSGFYPAPDGTEVAGASACIPEYGWTLLAEAPRGEILKTAKGFQRYITVSLAVTFVLMAALAAYLVGGLAKRIRIIAAATNRIRGGDYDVNLPVGARDEIGLLSESFNGMAAAVKERSTALRESEKRFRAILENTRNVVYLKDLEGRYIMINRRYEDLFHVKNEYVAGRTDYDFFPREAAEGLRRNDVAVAGSAGPLEFIEEIPQDDGIHTYISTKFRILGDDGRPYAVGGISTDITGLRRSEEALRRSEASLANAQRIANTGSWDWDMATDTVYWSDGFYRLLGKTRQEAESSYESFLSFVREEDKERLEKAMEEALAGKGAYSLDIGIAPHKGITRIVHVEGEVSFDPEDRPLKVSGSIQDITERKRAEERLKALAEGLERKVEERTGELERANMELEAAYKELESFSYTVAHDLKTPLRLIDGFTGLVMKDYGGALDEHGMGHLKRVRDSSRRMERLIDDLFTLSHAMAARLNIEEADLSRMAASIAGDLKRAEPQRTARVDVREGLKARCDPALVRDVLENLIANAWKFTRTKDEAVIEFGSGGREDGLTVFYVKDNGAGFDMKDAGKLFLPFSRIHTKEEFPGTGIGLATVARIISRHGGRVWAEGRPGEGAVFYFTLQGA